MITVYVYCLLSCLYLQFNKFMAPLQGERKMVKEITKGGFFGEVALVTKSSIRVADCIAKTR